MRRIDYSTLVENTHLMALHQLAEQDRLIRLARTNNSPDGGLKTYPSSPRIRVQKIFIEWRNKIRLHAPKGTLNQTAL